LAAVIKEEPRLDEIPAKVQPLLRRCLAKDPKNRLRDIGDAMPLLTEEAVVSAPASQSRVSWIIAGVCLAGISGLAFVQLRERSSEPRVFEYMLPAPEGTRLDEFALSPDARYLVMRAVGERGAQLWLRALDTLQTQPLLGTDGAEYPFWSPESSFIGFFAGRSLKKIAVAGGPVPVKENQSTQLIVVTNWLAWLKK
jgi:serine/threonine-protein kinase